MTERLELTEDGAWCWFQDPRAVRHVGEHDRTYAGWLTRGGDVVVGRHDHDTGGTERTVLHADFEEDDHDAPSIYFDDEGRALVFYTAHGGPDIRYRRGTDPESIAAFGEEHVIEPSTGHTYPNPREIGGDLYLFYRNANGSVSYVVSEDDGRTWSEETELVTTDGREWCVYAKLSAAHAGGVDLGLTYAEGGAHEPHRSIRHARFDGEALSTAAGVHLADAEAGATFWDLPLVYDSDETGHDAWIWDCAVIDGAPSIAYAELRSTEEHAYRHARFEGEWTDEAVVDGGSHITEGNDETYYSGGIYLDHERPGVCYCSVGDHEGSALRRLERADEGWETTELAAGRVQNVRPVVPRNRAGDLRVLWMQGSYTHYANREYETAIVGK